MTTFGTRFRNVEQKWHH